MPPKDAASTTPSLQSLLTQLSSATISSDKSLIATLSDEIAKLSLAPPRAHIIALLSQDEYSAALKLLGNGGDMPIEKAYCLYRLGREQEAISYIHDLPDRGAKHLYAQVLYRLERFDAAKTVYAELDRIGGDLVANERDDIIVNSLALEAQLGFQGHGAGKYGIDESVVHIDPRSTHEMYFNYATWLISQNLTKEAKEALSKAQEVLAGLRLDEEENELDLSPILGQLAYITQDGECNKSIAKMRTDPSTRFITCQNFLHEENPYKAYKVYATKLKKTARLFSFQERTIGFSRIMATHSVGLSVKNAVNAYTTRFPDEQRRIFALQTLLYSKYDTSSLVEALKADPKNNYVAVTLIVRYLQSKKGGVSKALDVIDQIASSDDPMPVGLVALRTQLYELAAQKQEAYKFLETQLASAKGERKIDLLKGLIRSKITSKDPEAAKDNVDELLLLSPTSRTGLAARTILSPNSSMLDLPDLSSIDVTGLELQSTLKRKSEDSEGPMKSKIRKKRKVRIPKGGLVDGYIPDPERWIPKRDRKGYKPSKKEKKSASGRTQGGTSTPIGATTQGTVKGAEVIRGAAKKKRNGKK